MALEQMLNWIRKAIPAPKQKNFNTQIGVHFEEVAEFLDAIGGLDASSDARIRAAAAHLHALATDIKSGDVQVGVLDPVEFLDAICDQFVTGVATAHMANLDVMGAAKEVADSNDSKFDEDGNPIFNADMKIMKGPNYFKAELGPFAADAHFTIDRSAA